MEIQEIKSRLSLSTVLSHYNLTPDKNHRLRCPFHDDRTPSLQIYPETNTCYCFSSRCKTHGKSMDVIDFIMHKENVGKHEAIVLAGKLLGESETGEKETGDRKKAGNNLLPASIPPASCLRSSVDRSPF